MLRSRLLLRIAALALVGCHSGEEAQAPSSRAETTSAATPAFPEHDARTALNAASPGLKSCRAEGAAPAAIDVAVTFAPSGKVSAVDVKTEDMTVATCVRAKLSEIAVMSFNGAPVTISMRMQL
jgi:hypothetical protein